MLKIKFLPSTIYFGNRTYNAGREGYYETGCEAFLKTIDDSCEVVYVTFKKPHIKCKEFVEGTSNYVTVKNLVPLTSLIEEENQNDLITLRQINLYLLKYKFTKNNNKGNCKTKTLK